ncbi:Fc.00g047690.m01.CDS01 [Cosmosporella sp. VM-42]
MSVFPYSDTDCIVRLTFLRRANQNTGQTPDQNQGQNRPARPARAVYGPQSALTDFLASHNISANRIRAEAEVRRRQALAENGETEEADDDEDEDDAPPPIPSSTPRRRPGRPSNAEQNLKKKKEEEKKKALEKVKSSKAFKKRKKRALDTDDEDDIAQALYEQSAPMPGQMENCEVCEKRFTVTPYSVQGPDGGLLCAPCGREYAKQKQGEQPKKKPKKQAITGGVGRRRAIQSRILDGDVGTKSLATLCVQTLAKNVELADSLGDLPDHLIDKIARMFSKRRLLKPETLPLFAQPSTETLYIYDGAKLGEQDLINIFQVAPNLRRLKVRCAIQFKDEVMDYVLSRDVALEFFYLHGANLLSEEKWHEFLKVKGQTLKGLQVYYTDRHFGDDTMAVIKDHCPNMARLKIENNQKLTDEGIKAIGDISSLEHLGLQLQNKTSSGAYSHAISKIGENLKTLSLKVVPEVDDELLISIKEHCRSLVKFRITDSENMTDRGFVNLFTDWANSPLHFIDLQKCRQMDATKPRENPDSIGLCSEGFKALMKHSGSKLRQLNIHACRHISREAFEEVFSEKANYPELRHLEISFCEEVTDFILGSIFRACPSIREVNVFGCMKVKSVRVPRGVILVGVPNAQGMMTEGVDD